MKDKKPDSDQKKAENKPETEEKELHPKPEQPADNDIEEAEDYPVRGLGLPDRDLKKNLGCG